MKTQILIFVLFVTTCLYSTIINIPGDQPTIQAGINVAADSDTVLVQPGTYVENINYNGKLITVGSLFLTTQDTTYIAQTIIDGNQNGGVVGFVNGETMDTVLTGFTITNGNSPTSGGGISCVYGSNPRLENLLITGNSAEYNGGGIICGAYASPSFDNVTITGNSAGGSGGGIYCYNHCNPSLENVIISDNTSHNGGGICCFENCTLNLDYVELTNNSATSDGGGILCVANSNLNLQNVTITENSAADEGGGIVCLSNSYPNLINVTLSNNTANTGGGIYCGDNSEPELVNCILWNNTPEEIYVSSSSLTATYSDIQDGWAGEGNIDEDPLFVGTGDHPFSLQDLSPCINAGIPDISGLNLPEFDLAGNLRVYGGRIDMGAYENQNVVVDASENLISSVAKLNQNYPNPFNPTTTISFTLNTENTENTKLVIYNLKGQKVKQFEISPESVREKLGINEVVWNGKDDNNKPVSSGIYFYKFKTDNYEKTKRMILLK